MEKTIYLDYNATTPIAPEVADAMRPYLESYFGNPSSSHIFGVQTRKAIETARAQVAELLNCFPDEIIFTSGGSESNNYAIKGVAFQNMDKGRHIITSAVEHPAVLEVCHFLETQGFVITVLPVDEFGMINPEDVEATITPETILISVMHANNEVGTIQPIAEIAEIAKKHNIIFHSDAAQSVGKIETDVRKMGVDLLSVAGHKLYAPKGIGALYIKRGIRLQKLIHGANHEQNLRAGTENVLEIVGLGKAAELALTNLKNNSEHVREMRNRLFVGISKEIHDLRQNGHPEHCLPNTLSLSFKNVEANTLLSELTRVAASAGAACHADNVTVSQVLTAMNVPLEFAMGTIRFSTGKYTTPDEIDEAIKLIVDAVKRLKPIEKGVEAEVEFSGDIKLTHFTHGLGCACKIRPQYLEKVLKDLPAVFDKNVLVGSENSDDAAVYRINENMAIVQTVDFFTPIVDDPYYFGAIAAANALSDIYAMGAKPLFALNIVGFPDNRLPMQVLKDILLGASDKAAEAGISILGGHTVEDPEPKFGMVVTGWVHPEKVITNAGSKPGDVLVLTKPVGTGIISTAVKRGLADEQTATTAREIMTTLNAGAAEMMEKFPVNSCTDITGFGLLGHLKEMVEASGITAEIYTDKVPVIPGVIELAAAGAIPGGTRNNLEFVDPVVEWDAGISDLIKNILCDAQTSGGLLVSLPENEAGSFINALYSEKNISGVAIGRVVAEGEGRIVVR